MANYKPFPAIPAVLKAQKSAVSSLPRLFAGLRFRVQWRSLALAFVLLCAARLLAQKEESPENFPESHANPEGTFVVHVNEVAVSFFATDKHHHWIADLSESEIHLRDNGLPPDSIRSFQPQTGAPLRIGLILDTSGSISHQFKAEKEAAALFVRNIVDPAKDLAFVLGFSNDLVLAQDLTEDRQALAAGVQKLKVSGTTAVYDAIDFSCKKLALLDGRLLRRILILVTDGHDNSSLSSPELVIENAIRSNVVVIVLNTEPQPGSGDPEYKILQKLAEETGGWILPASNKKQVAKALEQLNAELRQYYLLAYRPAQFIRDGSYRKIQLKTTRHGVHVICRRGYFAEPVVDK
jgi:Ca-activated chloride channel family protein